jgi:acetyl-CoA acetyltransferase
VAAKNLGNAAKNPLAVQADAKADAAAVLGSRKLYDPITEKMVAPYCDGCCAMVISNGKALKADKPVFVKGMGFNHDSYFTERKSLAKLGSLERAAKSCYAMAGISASDVQLAEVHENFAHEELMAYEALGFCGAGEGGAFFDSGATTLGGKLPVNASGGAISANVQCATGLTRVIEAAMQIRGEAGDHQVSGIKTAVATGQTGVGAQENIVFALGGE